MVTGQPMPAEGPARPLQVRRVSARDRAATLAYLRRDVRGNLLLIDLVRRMGEPPPPGEEAAELLGAWRAGELVGVAAIRPAVLFDAGLAAEALVRFAPHVARLSAGLAKGRADRVATLWAWLAARGARALLDRAETACVVGPAEFKPAQPPADARLRDATSGDLEDLVYAARASLAEEGRPDPYEGDPQGFRRWVRGRIPRARVAEVDGRVGFVGYADVRCREGWLLQGVYTWRDRRRRGLAKAGISDLCEAAFHAGANHVQLSVVDGNLPAQRLYEGLGFRPHTQLRTILFT
ncbi:MAG: GNAT family N-acetyltransferase [Deltaproteobacteria bacterium]|nr:MAG: GNAT family N-acetyltransferase [Deltaproteobacteria bacterium]